ncbi:decapping 5 [Artemisia annua]|uniref:Decapping 5 n=1 Tax=Artemisia annua TaxID=35608 RepID=A0A2U1PT92_ARTAN|nr:decapping 5 [Artemisia annua]
MASETVSKPPSSSSSADSYIGSLISLTSKSEIRYEGILYNINTEESSIGLTNVRSFGTEGRKKDGPQVMPSDRVYEYILFRGSDIKDLQVKSSQPVQPTQSINSDPAIIQSHYPRPPAVSSNLPPAAAASDPSSGPSTYNPQLGHPGSTFQGGLPLYQPGGNVGQWGPSPPPPNSNSAMPMYWPGYYPPPNALPQMHQQSLPRPPQGLGMPPSLQQQQQQPMQYPSFNASSLSTGSPPSSSAPNLPEYQSPLLPTSTSSPTLPSNSLLSSTLPCLPTMMQNKPPNSVALTPPVGSFQPPQTSVTTDVNVTNSPITPNVISGARYPFQGTSQPITSVGSAPLVPTESPTPSLVTPGQLLQSVPATIVSSPSPKPVQNDVEVVQVSPVSSASSVPVPVPAESQPPILPLPTQTKMVPKSNGATYHNRQNYNYRGRERGRGSGVSRPVTKFTEEFDFSAMNEKFNKDEVWGTLGKSNRSGSKEKDENATDEDEPEEENDSNLPKADVKPVYSKDDFFDSLSSNALDRQSNYGRTRFSEQMKLDTETFGEFSRYRGGGRGGRVPYRGGGRSRGGSYYGRGGGYGYSGRGRGGRNQNQNATNDY